MRGKSLALILLVTAVLGSLLVVPRVMSQVCPVGALDIKFVTTGTTNMTWTEPSHAIGDTFVMEVYADGGGTTGLWAWQAGVKWDTAYLNATVASYGEFLTLSGGGLQTPSNPTNNINNTGGQLYPAIAETSTSSAVTHGHAVLLFSITFKTLAFPPVAGTLIELSWTKVVWGPTPLTSYFPPSYAEGDATFKFTPSANQPPSASFTFAPGIPKVNETITFTSTSTDPDGFIKNVTWDFGDGSPNVTLTSGPWTVTHNYSSPASYSVSLWVWDNGKLPYFAELSDTETKTVKVVPLAPPSGVDVFTIKTWWPRSILYREKGHGPTVPGNSYGPGDTITLRAWAYYENVSMEDIVVGFEMRRPDGQEFVSDARLTNVAGNATISFRVPQSPRPLRGLYNVTVTCRIFEEVFTDWMLVFIGDTFTVIKIESSEPCDSLGGSKTTFSKSLAEPIYCKIVVNNTDPYDALPVLLTATILDSKNQTLGTISLDIVGGVPPGGTTTYIVGPLTIPSHAWVSLSYPGTDQNSAFWNWPRLGGVAYCPMVTNTIPFYIAP